MSGAENRRRLELPAKGRKRTRQAGRTAAWRPSRKAQHLALAIWIDRQIEAGRLRNDAHAARVLGVSRARLSQIMRGLLRSR